MKIKFIKEYRAIGDFGMPGKAIIARSLIGDTADNLDDEDAQWLIDNGFAEKAEEQWPAHGDQYWYVDVDGVVMETKWVTSSFDYCTAPIGNVFKTEKSAQRYVDYLKAVEAVRHDEGFMKPIRKTDYIPCGYGFHPINDKGTVSLEMDCVPAAGRFYFDTIEHAKASLDKHRYEWQTILNYDWSKE